MPQESRLGRALVLVILAMTLQSLFALTCVTLDVAEAVPPPCGTALVSEAESDGDGDALEVVFGDDPIVCAGAFALPLPEPRAGLAHPAPAHVPLRVADAADHPPRLA